MRQAPTTQELLAAQASLYLSRYFPEAADLLGEELVRSFRSQIADWGDHSPETVTGVLLALRALTTLTMHRWSSPERLQRELDFARRAQGASSSRVAEEAKRAELNMRRWAKVAADWAAFRDAELSDETIREWLDRLAFGGRDD